MKKKNHDNKEKGGGRGEERFRPDFIVSVLSFEAKPLSQPG